MADTETCEAAAFTAEGETAWECDRTDFEVVTMFDGGEVRLCPRHRSWAAAMGAE